MAMCRVLQVSRSGFYVWQRRGMSARTQTNQRLIVRMRVLPSADAGRLWGSHDVATPEPALQRRRDVRSVQMRQHETPAISNRLNQQCAMSGKNRV